MIETKNIKLLKERVLDANLELVKHNLVVLTWGNVSQIDRECGIIAIKPSGISYDKMTVDDIALVSINGQILSDRINPSSDTATHIELYKAFDNIGGITHTHSTFATICSQLGIDIECLGTTHADYFYGDIKCVKLTNEQIKNDYEINTGIEIVKCIKQNIALLNNDKDDNKTNGKSTTDKFIFDALSCPAILVAQHAPFVFGKSASNSVENSIVLEEVSKMYYYTKLFNSEITQVGEFIKNKHFFRKHGNGAYYGQNK